MFDETFAKELSRARRQVYPLTLLLFDMRDFKRMNDTYGHARGDQFLGCFARAVTETIRRSDYAFRIGGDEFAVLLPESDIENGHGLAKRTDERFQRYALAIAPVVVAKLDYGLASFPDNGDTLEKLFEVADRALYAEKNLRPSFVAEPAAQIQIAPRTLDGPRLPTTDTTRPEFAPHPEAAEAQKQKRRHTRLSMEGMDARGVLHDGPIGDKEVRLLDLAFGGIGFLLEESTPVPELFSARLHVPPFNDVDLRFRRVYTRPQEAGILRVGASIAN